MGTQGHGFRVLGAEALQDLGPQDAGGTHLRDFHEVVLAHVPEEGQPLGEGVDGQARFFTGTDIFDPVGQRIAQFQIARRAAFLDMIPGNGNRVELRHVIGRVFENIADDTHGHVRRIDVGVTDHEFLQDVVLNRAGHDLFVDALFFPGNDEKGQDRQDGPVHGHGNGHLVQGDAGEQDVHVQHGADGNACFPDVADDTGVIGVVAAVGSEVERDGQALLARCQVAAVERVRFFRRGETGVLTDGPGTEHVHGGIGPAQEGRNAADEVQVIAARVDIFRVQRFHRNPFQRGIPQDIVAFPGFGFQFLFPFLIRTGGMVFKIYFGKIRIQVFHYSIIPFFFCSAVRIS